MKKLTRKGLTMPFRFESVGDIIIYMLTVAVSIALYDIVKWLLGY